MESNELEELRKFKRIVEHWINSNESDSCKVRCIKDVINNLNSNQLK